VGRARANADILAADRNPFQIVDVAQVDQRIRRRKPLLHGRDQGLAAGDIFAASARTHHLHRLIDGRRARL
jgi:hypothetical protein